MVNLKQLVENDDMSVTEQNDFFKRELPQFTIENPDLPTSVHPKLERQFQEAHLIREQLHWLFSISKKMLKLSKTIKLPE